MAGRDLHGVVRDVQKRAEETVTLPRGYDIEYGGQFESEAAASERLSWLGAAVVAGIFVILLTAFRSSRDGFIVNLNLPLALIGGDVGVYVAGGVVSVASLISCITLFGIATRNGIMLASHNEASSDRGRCNRSPSGGHPERLGTLGAYLHDSDGNWLGDRADRARRNEPGNEIQAPMAIVIFFGLFTSTLLNMVAVPSVYLPLRWNGHVRTHASTNRMAGSHATCCGKFILRLSQHCLSRACSVGLVARIFPPGTSALSRGRLQLAAAARAEYGGVVEARQCSP